MIVGMFGFYAAWLERYEFRIRLYRRLQSLQPAPGQLTRVQETELMKTLWLPEHQALFEQLKSEILAKPVLARPDSNRRFYIKTDWCSNGMAAALLQADPDDLEALDAEAVETIGGTCFFDLQKKGIRLRPIERIYLSRYISGREVISFICWRSVSRSMGISQMETLSFGTSVYLAFRLQRIETILRWRRSSNAYYSALASRIASVRLYT